jgi:hypothetical protein
MDPPADQRWLRQLDAPTTQTDVADNLFANSFAVAAEAIRSDHRPLYLTRNQRDDLAQDTTVDALTAAASIANATNNTSLFFVVDVAGTKLLFPGDAQWGLWNAILDGPGATELLTGTRLYKVGHHGSHNGTDKHYARELMGDNATAMMSFHPVRDWPSIPNPNLITELDRAHRLLIRSDQRTSARNLTSTGNLVSEYTIDLT